MRVGKFSVSNAPIPAKMQFAKKPKGHPSTSSMMSFTGICVYTKTTSSVHTA